MHSVVDREGVRWARLGDEGVWKPPSQCAVSSSEVKGALKSRFGKDYCAALLPLPYYSAPMWPLSASAGWGAFVYVYCGFCGNALQDPSCRLALELVVGYDAEDGRPAVVVLARLLCPECSPADNAVLSAYPYALFSGADVRGALRGALAAFSPQITPGLRRCGVCGGRAPRGARLCSLRCGDAKRWIQRVRPPEYPSGRAEALLLQLVQHLRKRRVNVVRPLAWPRCHRKECGRRAEPSVACKKCSRVLYCSKMCKREAHGEHEGGCAPWVGVWDEKRLVFPP